MTLPATVLEAGFQTAVIDLARLGGWLVHAERPARTSSGWATPITGDAGFPDLVLAHRQRGVIFAELKSHRGRLGEAQEQWIDTLEAAARIEGVGEDATLWYAAGFRVYVWRPTDWDAIVRVLTPGARA